MRVWLMVVLSVCLLTGAVSARARQTSVAAETLLLEPSVARTGQSVHATGRGFCTACSPVTITVDERIAAAGIAVAADGSFESDFAVTELPGMYVVTAAQTDASGARIAAEAQLSVPPSDSATITVVATRPATTPPPRATPPPDATIVGATPEPETPPADATAEGTQPPAGSSPPPADTRTPPGERTRTAATTTAAASARASASATAANADGAGDNQDDGGGLSVAVWVALGVVAAAAAIGGGFYLLRSRG